MKINIQYLFICAMLVWMLQLVNPTYVAASDFGFDAVSVSEEQRNNIVKNLNIQLITQEPKDFTIACFDVNEYGKYALGVNGSSRKTVCIYNADSEFQYGYSLEFYGDFAVVLSQEDILSIYLCRSDLIVSVNDQAQCVQILKIADSAQNWKRASSVLNVTEKTVGEYTYCLERDVPLAFSYSRLVIKGIAGVEKVLYDVAPLHNFGTVFIGLFASSFFIYVIVRVIKKQKHQADK